MVDLFVTKRSKMVRQNPDRLNMWIAVFMIFILFPAGESDLSSDMAALVALQKAMGGRSRTRHWNLSDATPCLWLGVTCSREGVTELRLPGVGLVGQLPLGLGSLTQLHTLSLRLNRLSDPLPSDFVNLTSLRKLYLQNNLFSGEISEVLFGMRNLVRLNLANNNHTGPVPYGFNNLSKLEVLNLENNRLTGSIPDLDIHSLKSINVSFNNLSGWIPSKFSEFPASAFQGNSFLCGKPLQPCKGERKKLSKAAIAGIVIGSFVALLIIVLILRRKRRGRLGTNGVETTSSEAENLGKSNRSTVGSNVCNAESGESGSGGNLMFCGNGERMFDLDDLLKASAEVLGKGSFGTTYKVSLDVGMTVVVKRLRDVRVLEEEFKEKAECLGMMRHHNLVGVKGYYYGRDEKLLVCDYMPLGSLSVLLYGGKESGRSAVKWEARAKIALAAARAIAHLHSQRPPIPHGNIKSSNILLTKSYAACVSDFGLIHIATPASTPNHIPNFRAPEITHPTKVSLKADVYSFGVLLLELLTGLPPNNSHLFNDEPMDLPRWVHSKVEEKKTAQVFDKELLECDDNGLDEMVQLLHLALLCTAPHPDSRPSMAKVATRIDEVYCSVLLREQGTIHGGFDDAESAVSRRFYYSADSVMPPPSP